MHQLRAGKMKYRLGVALLFTAFGIVYWLTGDMHDQQFIDAQLPATTVATTTITTSTTTTTTTVLPIIYPPAPQTARCPQWWTTAQAAGWTYDELEHALDLIMWRESRCLPEVRSSTADTGLLQVNDIHLPMLADAGIGPDMLADPLWNLIAARLIADQAVAYGWKWTQPWSATYP
jgi:soluble lytic murein transglycosylase-like protein